MGITDLAIRIATTLDSRGINKADKSVKSLDKTVKNLGKTLGITLSAAAIAAYGRAAVKAFAEDEKAALSLARTVQNLGLGFEAQGAAVNDYLSTLEKQTGVLDDELRPAMDRLLRATLDITKAQELLNLSLDIAAGTGKSVTQVSQSLQKAYLGQTQAIGRLGVGLSKAELAGATFADIQERLTFLFAGQAQDAANSYAGQIDRLTIASNNAKETIGKGLVDALIIVSGSGDIEGLVSKMERFSESIANASVEMAKFIAGIKFIFNPKNIFKSGEEFQRMLALIDMGNPVRKFDIGNNAVTGYQKDRAAQTAALKAAKSQEKATKALTAEQKKQNALKKAGTIFDLTQIQIIAALKANLSKEDRKRLELQLALATENVDEVARLTSELAIAQGLGTDLSKFLASLPSAKNPFEAWKGFLDGIEAQAARIAAMSFQMANFQYTIPTGNFTYGQGNPLNTGVFVDPRGGTTGDTNITVNVGGSVTTSQSLIDEIRGGLNVAALSGSSANVERRIGGW